jgi:outer membrane receptor protein involved in Fe transport
MLILGTLTGVLLLAAPDAIDAGSDSPAPSQPQVEAPLAREVRAEPQRETVVTATRMPRTLLQVPATVTVIPRSEIERSPALTVDSLLRSEPEVATFRGNTSLVADPTAQGLNLRGVGPSGVSRALVLLDGLPVNDPFGGWVFWRSLPRLGLARIEIVPGPGSSLYGSSALGGVVQLISRSAQPSTLEAEASAGSFGTVDLAGRAAHEWGSGEAVIEGAFLRTDGFRIVGADKAGAIDRRARGDDVNVLGRMEVRSDPHTREGVRLGYFEQSQNGGTTFTDSRIRLFGVAATAEHTFGQSGVLSASVWGRLGQFDQRRARIAADRNSESLAGAQEVPLGEQGGQLQLQLPNFSFGGEHRFSVGLDFRRATGESTEHLFSPQGAESSRVAGGEQQFGGIYLQDVISFGTRLELLASVRADAWRNLAGHTDAIRFEERDEGQVSPRAGVLVRPLDWLAVRASAGTGFRAPTLNELYRPFQVGAILTAANPALVAERLLGAELGLELDSHSGVSGRITGYWNRLENPVTNVTLAQALPDGTSRERQNLGAARIQGLDASITTHFLRVWNASASYSWVDARVLEAGTPELFNKRLPLDPQHRGSAALSYDNPELLTATVQLRVVGPQFEDDRNTLPLPAYALVDLSVGRRLRWGIEAFAAVENLLNQTYVVGRAGIDTYGQPLMMRVGLRAR